MARILIVDDDKLFLSLMKRLLVSKGHDILEAEDGGAALEILDKESLDLVISDIEMKPVNGLELLQKSRDLYEDLQMIMLTNVASPDVAVQTMTKGAFDYITKPVKVDDLFLTVDHALEYCETAAENKRLRAELEKVNPIEDIVAQSNSMLQIINTISQVAVKDSHVFLYGEDGTSKERIARTIHRSSERKTGPFLAVNCDGLSPEALALDLFGSVNDSQPPDQDGLLETINGGTLFLDEITSMPIDFQSQLLEMMRTRKIPKPADAGSVDADIRVIVASSKTRLLLANTNIFHEELRKEVSTSRINIPPLRERPEDILPLVDQILHRQKGPKARMWDINVAAEKTLRNYTWPCNERELKATVRYAQSVAKNGAISNTDLPAQLVTAVDREARSGKDAAGNRKGYFFNLFMNNKDGGVVKQPAEKSEENKSLPPKKKNSDKSEVNWMG